MPLQKFTPPYKPRLRSIADVEQLLALKPSSLKREIGQAIFEEPTLCFAYLGGSIADGFANSGSDLDVYAVYKKRIPSGIQASFQTATGLSAQLAVTTIDSIDSSISYQNNYVGTIGDLDISRLQFFHRFGRGIPLHGEPAFRQQQVRVNWAKFRLACSGYSQFLADNNWEDALGNLDALNLDTAVLMAMQATGNALDGITSFLGETTPGRKWRYDKAKRVLFRDAPEIVERSFQVETFAPTGADQAKHDFVSHCEDLHSGLSDARLLLMLGCEISSLPKWLFDASTRHALYKRSPQSLLRLTLEGNFKLWSRLHGTEEVEVQEVLCWIALRGALNLTDLIERVSELSEHLAMITKINPSQAQSIVSMWSEKNHLYQ